MFHSARVDTSQTNPAVTSFSSDSEAHVTVEQGLTEQEHRQERISALEEPLLQPSHVSELPLSRELYSSDGGVSSHSQGRPPHGPSVDQLQRFPPPSGGIGSQQHRVRSDSRDTTNVEIHDYPNQ